MLSGLILTAPAQAQFAYKVAAPTADMVALLKAQVFTDQGKYYPCRQNPSCQSWGQGIAISDPRIAVDGTRIVFSVHVVGSYAMNAYLAPQVAGDLVVSGVPVVRDNKVRLSQPAVDAANADFTFQAFVQAVKPKVEQMVSEQGGFDLAQYLSQSARNPQLPPPRLQGIRCVEPSEIQVQSVATDPPASALQATVMAPPPPGRPSCSSG
jgi:hypothetical protein